jgi:hypothetical protein
MNNLQAFHTRKQRHLFCARYPQLPSPFSGRDPQLASPFLGTLDHQNARRNRRSEAKRITEFRHLQRQRYWYKVIENKEGGPRPLIVRNSTNDPRPSGVSGIADGSSFGRAKGSQNGFFEGSFSRHRGGRGDSSRRPALRAGRPRQMVTMFPATAIIYFTNRARSCHDSARIEARGRLLRRNPGEIRANGVRPEMRLRKA